MGQFEGKKKLQKKKKKIKHFIQGKVCSLLWSKIWFMFIARSQQGEEEGVE